MGLKITIGERLYFIKFIKNYLNPSKNLTKTYLLAVVADHFLIILSSRTLALNAVATLFLESILEKILQKNQK
jgi:hypothetical protein